MDKYKLTITGKNVKYILERLIKEKIDLLNIDYIDHNTLNIIIYKKDYNKLKKIKTTYKIKIIKKYGLIHILEVLTFNKILIILLIPSIILLLVLKSMIFKIEVIEDDINIKNIIYEELNKYNIKRYKFKKNYEELKKIKENILNNHKDKLEWIEIENIGTTYKIRLRKRKIDKNDKISPIRNIVSKKNAIIKSIDCKRGVIVKQRESYVKKGEVIISSEIKLNDMIKENVSAEGKVYGEVWYKAIIEYPYHIYSINYKEKSKKLVFNFLDKNIKDYKVLDINIIPIYIKIVDVVKLHKIDTLYTCADSSIKAVEELKKKTKNITNIKVLNKTCLQDKVKVELFYTTIENITDYN